MRSLEGHNPGMPLAIIIIVTLLVAAFAAAAGVFDRPIRSRRRVIVEEPAREVVVERPVRTVVTERHIVTETDPLP